MSWCGLGLVWFGLYFLLFGSSMVCWVLVRAVSLVSVAAFVGGSDVGIRVLGHVLVFLFSFLS